MYIQNNLKLNFVIYCVNYDLQFVANLNFVFTCYCVSVYIQCVNAIYSLYTDKVHAI